MLPTPEQRWESGWSDSARRARDAIQNLGQPVAAILVTHPHPDHAALIARQVSYLRQVRAVIDDAVLPTSSAGTAWTSAPDCATIDSLSASIHRSGMNLHEIRVFLTVADELHFGRAAERLFLSQPQVSRVVAAMEQRIGGTLFQRTSRSVRLTPLGTDLRDRLRPAVEQIDRAYDAARSFARGTTGVLWIGCTATTSGRALTELLEQFRADYPDCSVVLREQPLTAPYLGLESHDIDVLVFWQAGDIDDVTFGPVLERRARVLAVATDHPLAERASVSIEDVADFALPDWAADPARREFMSPSQTPSGRPIARAGSLCHTLSEALDLVARGDVVHTTVDSLAEAQRHRADLTFVPIEALPPLASGLMWRTADENARIRALADVARRLGEPPSTP